MHLDPDGFPVTDHREGASLPGGALAWDRLGVGHRCETWLAWSRELWCPVVVKFPRPHQQAHPRARQSLVREVRALAGNLHPGLPRLLDDGSAAAVPFLVFEHVDGPALDEEIDENGPIGRLDIALLAAQLLAALRRVHRRGIAHVDIKPDNVVLRGGRPVLLDFGSARVLGTPQPAGRPVGSPGYASPDLEAGAPISAAMDVYGVGITLYEAFSGGPAFDPDLAANRRPAPAPLPSSAPAALVHRMLAPDPAQRPDLLTLLHEFGRIAADAAHPPWPTWADRYLLPAASGRLNA